MSKVRDLIHEKLLELLDYDPATGVFVWKVARSNRIKAGSRAGVLHRVSGGRYISISGEKFMAHRLAFFYINKRWPQSDVRPLDGNYDNCAIANLQELSRVELQHKRGRVCTNTSGYVGVSSSKGGRWQSKITWNYKQIMLGASFKTPEEAASVYDEAARCLRGAKSEADIKRIVANLRLWKRQKAAWKSLQRRSATHVWSSFEVFCADVRHVPDAAYGIAPLDPSKPIGPDNYRWFNSVEGKFDFSTKEGRAAYMRARRADGSGSWRDRHLRKNYGIDEVERHRMEIAQGGLCAICNQPETKIQQSGVRRLSVDHDHDTGKIRALLCASCNQGIGYLRDDPELIRKAADYCEQHSRPVWHTPTLTEITHTALGQKLLQEAAGHG